MKMLREIAEHFNATSKQAHKFGQAYCGWLVSNEEFLSDLDRQVERSPEWLQSALPQQIFSRPPYAASVSENKAEAVLNWKSFVEKWRLQSMDTLDLPRPIAPQFTAVSPYSGESQQGMQLPAIPDIYPIEGKGLIAKQIESMRVTDDHLADWKTLISSGSRRKKRIDSLGRQYRLQHYWRVLNERYPETLHGKKDQLRDLFAAYFWLESPVSIHRDLKELGSIITRPLSRTL